ncbi:hypothetical protein GCM10009720_09330 [Yaniella flava]|uniref:Uncharacterized protein n=1 Tax=Yaniella flava TaxID=287930 RepID=A0ABP5FPA4_9MICC
MNTRRQPRNVGRSVQRLAATCALTAFIGGASMLTADHAAATDQDDHSEQSATVFWKELDRIEDTNENGTLGDPGDTSYWNFYGGGTVADPTQELTIEDPMIFGDEDFSIDSKTIQPDPQTVEDLDAVRKVLQGEALKELGNIPPLPKESDYETTDEMGATVFDEESFNDGIQAHHSAQEDHFAFVANAANTSDVFQDSGFRWAMVPQGFTDQIDPDALGEVQLPEYVARMQFEHVITQGDVTEDDDGICTVGSTATSNYSLVKSDTPMTPLLSEASEAQAGSLATTQDLVSVRTVADVECAPDEEEPEPEATSDPTPEPEQTEVEEAPVETEELETQKAVTPPPVDETPTVEPTEEETQHNPFDDPDRVEPINISSGNASTPTPMWPLWTGVTMISVAGIGISAYAISRLRVRASLNE